jgi:hypothetical protein
MDNQNQPNSGVLFAGKVKTNPKAPDYSGTFTLDMRSVEVEDNMVTFKISGWKRVSKNGNTFLSLAVNTYRPDPVVKPKEEEVDDVPF